MLDDLFGVGPSYDLLKPFAGDLAVVTTTIMGIGVLMLVGALVLSFAKIGTSGSNIDKSARALMGMKNALFGLGGIFIGLPLLLAALGVVATRL